MGQQPEDSVHLLLGHLTRKAQLGTGRRCHTTGPGPRLGPRQPGSSPRRRPLPAPTGSAIRRPAKIRPDTEHPPSYRRGWTPEIKNFSNRFLAGDDLRRSPDGSVIIINATVCLPLGSGLGNAGLLLLQGHAPNVAGVRGAAPSRVRSPTPARVAERGELAEAGRLSACLIELESSLPAAVRWAETAEMRAAWAGQEADTALDRCICVPLVDVGGTEDVSEES